MMVGTRCVMAALLLATVAYSMPTEVVSLDVGQAGGQGADAVCDGNDDGDYCRENCGDGETPTCAEHCGAGDDAKNCEACAGDTPYADHEAHACVGACPEGSTANDATKDCDADAAPAPAPAPAPAAAAAPAPAPAPAAAAAPAPAPAP